MNKRRSHDYPLRLQKVRQRFVRWRRSRKPGARIPEPMWTSAVKMATTYGLHPTAKALGLDYNSLKRHIQQATAVATDTPEAETTFVDLTASPLVSHGECIVELEDTQGASMRIHLKGVNAPDLTALSHSFWNTQG